MIRFTTSATALVMAAVSTQTLAADARLLTRQYKEDEVVRIEGRAGVQATIAFGEDEHIENVAIGDSNSWQVTPNKRANLLFVKPLAARARTNMTVITDRHGYYFDLVASPTGNAMYRLSFKYPDDVKGDGKATVRTAGLNPAEAELVGSAQDLASAPADASRLNYGWKQRGNAKLMPARIYDDGKSTFIGWAAGQPLPAVLIRNESGAEGPVNYAVRDDLMVIEGVPSVIVLRSGRDSATLEYAREAPVPAKRTQTAGAPLATAAANPIRGQ